MTAVWAARARGGEVERFALGNRLVTQFGRLGMPLPFHHFRKAVNHDIEKTPDEQAEQGGKRGEYYGVAQKFGHEEYVSSLPGVCRATAEGGSDHFAKFEDGQIHRDDQAADHDAEEHHDEGFE
ncbi:hypothetical protein AZKH_3573 [Azoarcus sp. KH32C]|nr:hypothetical protein AZKH_3573 [Azoarcus sp. KH32C]